MEHLLVSLRNWCLILLLFANSHDMNRDSDQNYLSCTLQLDLLPDAKCHEICRRSGCQDNSWVVPVEGRTSLSAVSILLFILLLSFRKSEFFLAWPIFLYMRLECSAKKSCTRYIRSSYFIIQNLGFSSYKHDSLEWLAFFNGARSYNVLRKSLTFVILVEY